MRLPTPPFVRTWPAPWTAFATTTKPLIITRNGEQSVVMLSLEDYKALEETAYLLRTPANAKRLLSAAAQLNAGKGVERKLAK